MERSTMLPLGFRFLPTRKELITDYLLNKTMGQPLPSEDHFVECDLYGSHSPWQLLNDNEQWLEMVTENNTIKSIYVFTTLKYLGVNGQKRMARTAGCGSWHKETGAKPIFDENNLEIGKMEMFTFISNDPEKENMKGHWIMHEFALSGSTLDYVKERSLKSYVVCKITKDESKLLKVSPTSKIKKKAKVEKESGNNPLVKVQVDYEFSRSLRLGSVTSMKPTTTTSLSGLASSRCEELYPFTSQNESLYPFELEEPMFTIEELLMSSEKDKEDGAQETTMLQERRDNPEIAYSLSSLVSSSSSSEYEESDPSKHQKEYIDPFEKALLLDNMMQETCQREEIDAQETATLQENCALINSLATSRYEESDPCMNQKQSIDPFEIEEDRIL